MNFTGLAVFFNFEISSNSWEAFVSEYQPDGSRIPIKITIERLPAIAEHARAFSSARLSREDMNRFAVALKRGLTEAGFLADTSTSEAELKATKLHLEDMRAIALGEVNRK